MDIITVGDLKERLDRDFQDTDKLSFEVVLDGENRSTYYGNVSVFVKDVEYSGSGDCVLHISGDVDEEG
jgi:hypothetical protein